MGKVFDKEKFAEVVEAESAKRKELEDCAHGLNDLHALPDSKWDSKTGTKYTVEQLRHGQLTRELETIRNEKHQMELLEPEAAKRGQKSAFARFLRQGKEGLEAAEHDLFLGDVEGGADLNALPTVAGAGDTFVIKAATVGDEDVGTRGNQGGGEAIEETVVPRVIDRLQYFGGVSKASQQFMTGTGNDYRLMQMDASNQKGELLGHQNAETADEDIPNIGVVSFGAKTCSSKSITLTREMIQDAVFDIQGYIERQAIRRMGRTWNEAFTTGDGQNGMPLGVVIDSLRGLTTASSTAVTWVELTNLIYEIDRGYRDMEEMGEGGFSAEGGGMLGYMISDPFEKLIRVLTDGDNRPLWVPSTREGVPSMLNGYPYVVNGDMADVAAGNIPCLFGNFSYYGIRTVSSIEIFRFLDSRTMQKNAVECLAFSRRDGRTMGARRQDANQGNAVKCEAIAHLRMKP